MRIPASDGDGDKNVFNFKLSLRFNLTAFNSVFNFNNAQILHTSTRCLARRAPIQSEEHFNFSRASL